MKEKKGKREREREQRIEKGNTKKKKEQMKDNQEK